MQKLPMILWKSEDLGHLTVDAAAALAKNALKPRDTRFKTGSLGEFEIQGDNIMPGTPFTFNKDNIDHFGFYRQFRNRLSLLIQAKVLMQRGSAQISGSVL